MRRTIKKTSMHEATMAKKPKTTITAMAQCGNSLLEEPAWSEAEEVDEEVAVTPERAPEPDALAAEFAAAAEAAEAEAAEADAAEAADADDADAADADDADDAEAIDATTKSARVVSVRNEG